MAEVVRSRSIVIQFSGLARDIVAILFLVAACTAFVGSMVGLFNSDSIRVPLGDLTNQFYPLRSYYVSEIAAGRLPLWNPYILAGHPFLADPQMAVLYPPNLLSAMVVYRPDQPLVVFLWKITLSYAMAAAFTYLFIKQTVGSRFGAIVGSLMFALGGFLTSYPLQQLPILETVLWLPLVLFFVERGLVSQRQNVGMFALAGVALAMAYLAGHSQTAMLITYTCLLYLLVRSALERPKWKAVTVHATTLLVVAIGLSAIQLVPTIEFFLVSSRTLMTFEASSQGYDLGSMVGILIPGWRGELALYAGAIAPPIILLARFHARRSALIAISIPAVLALVLSMGKFGPLFQALYLAIPGFALFRHQERAIFIFQLAICLAVAAGLGSLFDRSGPPRSRLAVVIGGAAAALTVATTALLLAWAGLNTQIGLWSYPYQQVFLSYILFGAMTFTATAVVVLTVLRGLNRQIAQVLLLSLFFFDMFAVNWVGSLDWRKFELPAEAKAAAEFARRGEGTFRVAVADDSVLPPNYPALFGLQHSSGDTPLKIGRIADLLEKAGGWKIWQLFNVKYAFSRGDFGESAKQVFESGGLRVYQNQYGLPRAYAVRKFEVAQDPEDELQKTIPVETHPGEVVILASPPTRPPTFTKEERPEVDILTYEPRYIKIGTRGMDDSILVVLDAHYPGWKTLIDGNEVATLRANYAFRGVELPRGEHIVEMVYDPVSLKIGAAISGVTALVLLALAAIRVLGRARKRPRATANGAPPSCRGGQS